MLVALIMTGFAFLISTSAAASTSPPKFNLNTTAFLFLDYMNGVLGLEQSNIQPQDWNAFVVSSQIWLNATYQAKGNSSTPVIGHTQMGFTPELEEVSSRNTLFTKLGPLFPFGSNATEFAPGFEPQMGGVVIHKQRYSAAYNSNLLTLLWARSIQTVVLSGLSTTGTVLGTVSSLTDMDFLVYMINETTIDATPEIKNNTLTYLASRATTISLEQALAALQ